MSFYWTILVLQVVMKDILKKLYKTMLFFVYTDIITLFDILQSFQGSFSVFLRLTHKKIAIIAPTGAHDVHGRSASTRDLSPTVRPLHCRSHYARNNVPSPRHNKRVEHDALLKKLDGSRPISSETHSSPVMRRGVIPKEGAVIRISADLGVMGDHNRERGAASWAKT